MPQRPSHTQWLVSSDVNKATSHKAKARELKAKDFQDSPRPGQGHTATVLNQINSIVHTLSLGVSTKSDLNQRNRIFWFLFFLNRDLYQPCCVALIKNRHYHIIIVSFNSVQYKFQF